MQFSDMARGRLGLSREGLEAQDLDAGQRQGGYRVSLFGRKAARVLFGASALLACAFVPVPEDFVDGIFGFGEEDRRGAGNPAEVWMEPRLSGPQTADFPDAAAFGMASGLDSLAPIRDTDVTTSQVALLGSGLDLGTASDHRPQRKLTFVKRTGSELPGVDWVSFQTGLAASVNPDAGLGERQGGLLKPLVPTSSEQRYCLALTIYFEARGEPDLGKLAVAHVVMNRVGDRRFPDTICKVVRQGGEQTRYRCQFTWWCDGLSDRPENLRAWEESRALAEKVYWGRTSDPTDGALWYHADYVAPRWAMAYRRTSQIGRHIFYQPTPRRGSRVAERRS